jgi:hypothetical protein
MPLSTGRRLSLSDPAGWVLVPGSEGFAAIGYYLPMRRYALLAALLAVPTAALACRCDFKGVRELAADPLKARTALIGLKETAEAKVIRVERAWTKFTGALADPGGSTCALTLEPRRRYLILSLHPAEFLEKRGLGPTICDSIAKELSSAAPEIKALAARAPESYAIANPSWFFCAADADCVDSRDACGGLDAVNEKYRDVYRKWTRKIAPTLDCQVRPPPAKTRRPACLDAICGLR